MTQQVIQFTQDYGCAPVWQIALDLEQLVDRATSPGTFRRLYYRWFDKNIRASARHWHGFVPTMVRRLRATQDIAEFSMILRFLSDCSDISRLPLAFVLGESSAQVNFSEE